MGLLLFGSLLLMMFLGVPIAFAILGSGTLTLLCTQLQPLTVVAQKLVNGLDSFPLIAVPLFIFAGNLMDRGGISKRLVDWCESLTGGFTGGLGAAAVVTCAVFAALTGSGPATVAAVGSIMIPSMVEKGYEKHRATGLVTSAGALGPIIPPSTPMIIYGCTMGVSIPYMFMGGVLPGALIALALIVVNYVTARKNPALRNAAKTKFSFRNFGKATVRSFPTLLMPLIILGGIYGGVFTPTEAAAVACVYGLILSVGVYREIRPKELPEIVISSMKISAMAVFICGCANLLSFILTNSKMANAITNAIVSNVSSPYGYLAILIVLLLIVGCFLDVLAAILILAPMLIPAGVALGWDPLFLGCLFCIVLVIGLITPPFGVNLFTATAIADLKFEQVVKGVMPFLIVEVIAIVIIALNPWLIMWLPSLMS
ncbi:TRAP transporter large permease [Hominifimenecus sp. rT4P-3]|uniref:TRAP transporter large permease n=1 Tax=Hominifimenecus sp. rT4P-3 TaxID=3242979 RepID=UPI003DA58162